MLARAAALTLLLSGPGLASPPAPMRTARGEEAAACASSPAFVSPALEVESARQRPHWRSGVVFGVAAVFTVATGVVAGVVLDSKNDLRRHVAQLQEKGYRTDIDDLLLEMQSTRYKANRGLAIGWGVLAAGLWGVGAWLYTWDRAAAARRTRVTPVGGSHGAGLVLTGRF